MREPAHRRTASQCREGIPSARWARGRMSTPKSSRQRSLWACWKAARHKAEQVPARPGRSTAGRLREVWAGADLAGTVRALNRRMSQQEGRLACHDGRCEAGSPCCRGGSAAQCTTRPRLNFGTEPDAQRRLSGPSSEKHNGVLHRGAFWGDQVK